MRTTQLSLIAASSFTLLIATPVMAKDLIFGAKLEQINKIAARAQAARESLCQL